MLQNVIKKLKGVAPVIWLRCALCLLTVVSISVGGSMLDSFIVHDGSTVYHIVAHAESADKVLNSAGIDVLDGDIVTSTSHNGKTVISIDRTFSQLDGLTNSSTSQDVITHSDSVALKIHDVLSMEGDGTYNVYNSGVTYEYETETVAIKHGYKTVKSRQMDKGTSSIKKGVNGEKRVVYLRTKINGVTIASEVCSEEVVKEPVTQVETVGTRVKLSSDKAVMTSEDVNCISTLTPSKPIELDKNGIPVSYLECISGKASAYWQGTATATGVKARPGYIAVNPKQIPYGTKMYIVSQDGKYVYGYAIAADTGGFAYNGSGRMVDLRFPNAKQGYAFGVRMVNIYILE